MQALAAQGFCQKAAEASAVYPALRLLTDMGMLSASTGPAGQTVYTMLDEGAAVLASNRPLIGAIMAEPTPAGRSAGQGRGAGRRRRHCCGQQAASEAAPAA
jgi:DNA-binding PadR family transcriptional regulator